MKKLSAFFALICAILLFSCKKTPSVQTNFGGQVQTIYDGKATTNLKTDEAGLPLELALSFDTSILNSLPVGVNARDTEFILTLNDKVLSTLPFNHIQMNWNPNGHPPAHVYDVPHFDFHFYMVPVSEVLAATDDAKLNSSPNAEYLPINYVAANAVPQMGKHWLDRTSPELTPNGSFTSTFIYGSYDSKVTFYEPMITKAFLKSTTSFVKDIPQPAKYAKAGYYPTEYLIRKVDNNVEIVLDKFVLRTAS